MMTRIQRPWLRFLLLGLIASLGLVALAACGGDGDDDSNGDGGNGGAFDVQPEGEGDNGDGGEGGDGGDGQSPAELGFMGPGVNPPIPKPDFTLTDTNGEDFDIQEETEGYVTLMYFGYTNCPDACPTHMQDVAATFEDLSEEQREQIKVVFVTTDPERDTPERLREWLDLFDESFIGLTGSQEKLAEIQRAVGMPPAQQTDATQEDGGYEVQHATFVIAFTAETNTAPTVYPSGVSRDAWLNDMQLLTEEGYTPDEETQG